MTWEISKFVLQMLITVGGAFLAAYLATIRHRNDKWWERKESAYSEIIDALHKMKWPSSEHFDAEIQRRELEHSESQELWQEFNIARRNVWRIADSASFIVDSQVLTVVQEMEQHLDDAKNARSWFEHLDDQYAAVDKCLQEIKKIGKRDLGIKKG